jgi:methylase of polypeptide subunit release factors
MQFDFITCNPPWIPSEYIAEASPLDNGVFDPKETFLNSALNFASKETLSFYIKIGLHLSPKGEMLMIYSDLALILGLQEENRVSKLANQHGLRAELVDKVSFSVNKKPNDPLKNIKQESKVQLYRITK